MRTETINITLGLLIMILGLWLFFVPSVTLLVQAIGMMSLAVVYLSLVKILMSYDNRLRKLLGVSLACGIVSVIVTLAAAPLGWLFAILGLVIFCVSIIAFDRTGPESYRITPL